MSIKKKENIPIKYVFQESVKCIQNLDSLSPGTKNVKNRRRNSADEPLLSNTEVNNFIFLRTSLE